MRHLRYLKFIATAVLTPALGIGATSAIFSVACGVLLRAVPYSRADGPTGSPVAGSHLPRRVDELREPRLLGHCQKFCSCKMPVLGVSASTPRERTVVASTT
jgi:hypothetical protein